MAIKNIFTIDLEDWYHANYHSDVIKNQQSRLEKPTLRLLELLKKKNSLATFFVLGSVAQQHPDLIKEIKKQGHEIASHSYAHRLVYSMTQKEFEIDLEKSTKIIQKITGQDLIGYRAPSWSVDQKRTPWFWQTLKKHGYKYSSSLFPFTTFLYGDSKANPHPHQIDGLTEIPPTVFRLFNLRIPFSGGFYLRFFPLPLLKSFSKQNPNVWYIHPREIDIQQPRLQNLSLKENFIHYFNISTTYNKLNHLLKKSTNSFIKELNL